MASLERRLLLDEPAAPGAPGTASRPRVRLEHAAVRAADPTHLTPLAGGVFATRQLYMSGNAVLHTVHELRDRLLPVAARCSLEGAQT